MFLEIITLTDFGLKDSRLSRGLGYGAESRIYKGLVLNSGTSSPSQCLSFILTTRIPALRFRSPSMRLKNSYLEKCNYSKYQHWRFPPIIKLAHPWVIHGNCQQSLVIGRKTQPKKERPKHTVEERNFGDTETK